MIEPGDHFKGLCIGKFTTHLTFQKRFLRVIDWLCFYNIFYYS